jgi:hypothetical protein
MIPVKMFFWNYTRASRKTGATRKNGKKGYGTDKTAGCGRKGESVTTHWPRVGAAWCEYNGFL